MVEQALIKSPQAIDGVTFRQIAQAVATSEYGKKLKEQTRFSPYRPEGISTLDWQRLLGADVNNLLHMPMTARITNFFTYYSKNPPKDWPGTLTEENTFTEREEALLVLAANIHDVGEAITGDIPSPVKTEKDHEDEMVILKEQMHELFGEEEIYPAVQEAIDTAISPRDTKLAKAFHAIEHLGYLRVAIRAWERRSKITDQDTLDGLNRLIESVRNREFPRQYEYAKTYPATFEFLNRPRNKKAIEEMLTSQ